MPIQCRSCKRVRRDAFLIILQCLALGYGAFSYLQYGKTSLGIGITLLVLAIVEHCKRVDQQTQTIHLFFGKRHEDHHL